MSEEAYYDTRLPPSCCYSPSVRIMLHVQVVFRMQGQCLAKSAPVSASASPSRHFSLGSVWATAVAFRVNMLSSKSSGIQLPPHGLHQGRVRLGPGWLELDQGIDPTLATVFRCTFARPDCATRTMSGAHARSEPRPGLSRAA